MRHRQLLSAVFVLAANLAYGELPKELDRSDRLFQFGLLDVTKIPYSADPTGQVDSTAAIQRAVNDARDHGLVCFFPEGVYLISDTLSCEQQVRKLDRPRQTDGRTQHYWDEPHKIVMFGSTKGKRPVLKLSKDAKGFADPARPKIAVWIWAQTRDDAPGKQEPEWGKEQPNISFGHYFKGIDIDIRGHAGAIGIRHAGSQGSAMLDCTIQAEGAYAGMNNCCGQGGGTYNMEVLGGRYGIVIEPGSRFPLLTACTFRGQTEAAIRYARGGSQVPTLLVGCRIEPAGPTAIDFTTERSYAGISLVDCAITLNPGGVLANTRKRENLYIENTFVKGAGSICTQGAKLPDANVWTHIERYASHTDQGVNLLNGIESTGEIAEFKHAPEGPDLQAIRDRHYRGLPSFEDDDVVNVKTFGAKGDGTTDDTQAFAKAIQSHDKIFVPKGNYRLSGTLTLGRYTLLFGLTPGRSVIGGGASAGRRGRGPDAGDSFVLATVDDAEAAPAVSLLRVQGRVDWRSGQGTIFLAPAPVAFSGHAGGRIYGMMAQGGPLVVKGIQQPLAFYALNVERKGTNPQSEITDSAHVRVYYFKVEAGTISRADAGDGNTPCRISDSTDIRVYCMYGVVRKLGERPMLEVVDSRDVAVSQLKTLSPGSYPHLIETFGSDKSAIPSSKIVGLFVREVAGGSDRK
ncbi:MAG: hypothetical protein FJ276_18215 [Planctomycetes bacterium]|nr:hypothetical protein [Planctomycetota bacterium]